MASERDYDRVRDQLAAVAPEPDAAELHRLRLECCKCEKCGHVQAEPNWCHECGHRVEVPVWAGRLLEAQEDAASLREALTLLANEAARAVCEPRRFCENEDDRQQRLGDAVAVARIAASRPTEEADHAA